MHGCLKPFAVATRASDEDVGAARYAAACDVVNAVSAEIEAREAERARALVDKGSVVLFALAVYDQRADWISAEVLWTGSHTLVVQRRPWSDDPAPAGGDCDVIWWHQLRDVRGWPETHEGYREAIERLSMADLDAMRLRVGGALAR